MAQAKSRTFWILVVGTCFPVVAFVLGGEHWGLDSSLVQQILFPFALISFLLLAPLNRQVRMAIVAFAALGGILGATWNYSFDLAQASSEMIMARLKDDPHEANSQMIRDGINRWLSHQSLPTLKRSLKEVRSARQAKKRFPLARVVLWGDPKVINISFAKNRSTSPLALPVTSPNGDEVNIKLHRWTPAVAVETKPIAPTTFFLSQVLAAETALSREDRFSRDRAVDHFMDAGSFVSSWNQRTHLGYAWWRASNLLFERAIETFDFWGSESQCAFEGYGKAAGHLRPYAHPHLRAAIFNNKAALILARSVSIGKGKGLKNASFLLKKAFWMTHRPDQWKKKSGTRKTISQNLHSLKKWRSILQTSRKQDSKRKSKRKRKDTE